MAFKVFNSREAAAEAAELDKEKRRAVLQAQALVAALQPALPTLPAGKTQGKSPRGTAINAETQDTGQTSVPRPSRPLCLVHALSVAQLGIGKKGVQILACLPRHAQPANRKDTGSLIAPPAGQALRLNVVPLLKGRKAPSSSYTWTTTDGAHTRRPWSPSPSLG